LVLNFGHFGKKIRNVLKCCAGEGWRRVENGSIVGKVKKGRRKDTSYVQLGERQLTGLVTSYIRTDS
jgi:hypothetical protein